MVNEHFTHIMGGGTVVSPRIWECTRFCLARGADSRVAAGLMLGGGEIMRGISGWSISSVCSTRGWNGSTG
jgi:N-acyl-L-homoserine lactone synthetase